MRKLKLRLRNVPKNISCDETNPHLNSACSNVSNSITVLKNFFLNLIIVVPVETSIHTELLVLWASPALSTSHVSALWTMIRRWEAVLFSIFFFELDGYDKIAQVLWLKRSADKLKLTKVVKLLKVYGNLMGFILHCISNDFTQCQPRVKAQLISVGFPIYGISEWLNKCMKMCWLKGAVNMIWLKTYLYY